MPFLGSYIKIYNITTICGILELATEYLTNNALLWNISGSGSHVFWVARVLEVSKSILDSNIFVFWLFDAFHFIVVRNICQPCVIIVIIRIFVLSVIY